MDQAMKKYSVGIDIGGTKCAVVLGKGRLENASREGFILDRIVFPTKEEAGWRGTVQKLISSVEELWQRHQVLPGEVVGIGISCGGPLDHKKGMIMSPPNLYGWDQVPIVEILQDQFRIPVHLENDANACAVAEWKFGVARGMNNIIFLTFGTGLGAGLILDGKLYHGASDMAGEAGHIRLAEAGPVGYGKSGSFEGFCSGSGISQLAGIRLLEELQQGKRCQVERWCGQEKITAESLAAAAREGDAFAHSVFDLSAVYLGKGLAVLIDILNPEMIVIGSVYERCQELFQEKMWEVLRKEALESACGVCRVEAASLGNEVGDYAALAVAFG